jgi:hypothetical protein
MTLDYLMKHVMDSGAEKREEWFNFLWNRTRAIRKVGNAPSLARDVIICHFYSDFGLVNELVQSRAGELFLIQPND